MRPHGRGYSSCPGCLAARAERSGRALPGRPERHRGRGLLQFLGQSKPTHHGDPTLACKSITAFPSFLMF